MARYAIHRGKLVTAQEFLQMEGRDWRNENRPGGLVWTECPSCGQDMGPHKLPGRLVHHFVHRPGPDTSDCPLSSKPNPRIQHLISDRWDIGRGKKLRGQFCEEQNLKSAFHLCNRIAESVTSDEFIAMVRAADRFNIWRYSDLPLDFVPYLLMTLTDLRAADNSRRNEKLGMAQDIRFVIHDAPPDSLHHLWERPGTYELRPVFADSGKPIRRIPIRRITDSHLNAVKNRTDWILEPTYRKLHRNLCGNRK